MANPLFNALGGGMPGIPGPMGQFGQMMQQFQQFKANFQGDPKAEVQKLLQSGKMSQEQLNQLQAMAQQFQQFLPHYAVTVATVQDTQIHTMRKEQICLFLLTAQS